MPRLRLWTSCAALLAGSLLLVVSACGGSSGSSSSGTGSPTGGATGNTTGAVQGGTAKFNLQSDTDYVDPALAYYSVSWGFEYATCAKLLNYPDKAGAEGSQLQPEVASGMPQVSSDGKTYTFTIKDGFKFSPPSSEVVDAATFKGVIERDLNPKMASPAASFMTDIVGAPAYLDGKANTVSGVTASGNKLTIKLTDVAPDFLARVAMPFFCALPKNTEINGDGLKAPVPSAGPYYISSYDPNRSIVLKRNPNYSGDRPHNLDTIRYDVGVDPNATKLQIEQGSVDWAADGVPPSSNAELGKKYGPNSQAAKDGKQQYFVNPILSFRYLALNTTRPTFKDEKVRQAVNFALDRRALLTQRGAFAGQATDQYLPPGIPGYKDADIYPLGAPNVDKAKQLAGSLNAKAVMYTCNESPCPESGQIVQNNLKAIGIDVELRQFARAVQFKKQGTKGEPFDIAFDGWQADYADPFDFINILLSGDTIRAANNNNFSYFNDPQWNKKMTDASRLAGEKRYAAYAQLDADLAQGPAPLAAWDNDNERDFFSARVGCQLFQPVYGMDLAALCARK
jgi:peptide/nickel transport system substrate-binding protein